METLVAAKKQSWLSWFLRGVLILGFCILLARLLELQIIQGNYFRGLADGNRVRKVTIPAPRGRILARGGEELVGNVEVKKRIIFNPQSGYSTTDELEDAPDDEIISQWIRDYKLGEGFAHASGYLGSVNEDEVGKIDPKCPERGPRMSEDFVGRGGLEEIYNCELSGTNGEEIIEVDTTGKKVRTIGRREPIPGKDIRTTIDFGLQKASYQASLENKGAVVASTPDGEILAIVSTPSFDPNYFVRPGQSSEIRKIFDNKDLPLFNRSLGGLFHPGSVFKPVVAIASLEEKVIQPDFTFTDTGVITVNNFSYSNWYFTQYGGTEGSIDLTRAIARSTDTFFYKIGEYLGANKLVNWTEKFGFGKLTGIDVPGEVSGLVPSPTWKLRVKGEPWFLGNTYHFSIGQGDLAVTPLEVNQSIATIANRGKLCVPHLILKDNAECHDLKISKLNLDTVVAGMRKACEEGGTGFTFFDFNPRVACKTGTAETNDDEKTHAWFTLFGPIDEGPDLPEIVMTVLVERGGEGSKVAGPIARKIMDYWRQGRP